MPVRFAGTSTWAFLLAVSTLAPTAAPTLAGPSQEAGLRTEFLATLRVPTDPAQVIARDLTIINVPEDREGFLRGPRIRGRPIPPCADWLTILPGGRNLHTDVRCTIRTNDDSLIYVEYPGAFVWNDAALAKCQAGRLLDGSDLYFRIQPRFRAGAGRYAWLNGVVAVGQMTALKCGSGSYTEYDIYVVR
jgi:hypothetical protein